MKRAYLYLHIAVLLAGLTGIFGKLITLNATVLVFYRTLFSAIALAVLLLVSRKVKKLPLNSIASIMMVGCVITGHWMAFYSSIQHSNVSIGVVCFCLTGFFTAILKPFFGGKFVWQELLLSFLVLVGIILIFSFDTTYRFGILMGIFSAFLASLFTILNEKLILKYDVFNINFYQMAGGSIFAFFFLLYAKWQMPNLVVIPNTRNLIYLFILALFCTVVLYVLVLKAQQLVSAFTINLSFNLEPIYSILLAIFLFHENKELKPAFYIGCGLIILSISIQMLRIVRQSKKMILTPE